MTSTTCSTSSTPRRRPPPNTNTHTRAHTQHAHTHTLPPPDVCACAAPGHALTCDGCTAQDGRIDYDEFMRACGLPSSSSELYGVATEGKPRAPAAGFLLLFSVFSTSLPHRTALAPEVTSAHRRTATAAAAVAKTYAFSSPLLNAQQEELHCTLCVPAALGSRGVVC